VPVVWAVPWDDTTQTLSILISSIGVQPSWLAVELLPTLMESAFVLCLVTIGLAMWSRKLTPRQLFWLVTILMSIFFVVTMLFSQKYT